MNHTSQRTLCAVESGEWRWRCNIVRATQAHHNKCNQNNCNVTVMSFNYYVFWMILGNFLLDRLRSRETAVGISGKNKPIQIPSRLLSKRPPSKIQTNSAKSDLRRCKYKSPTFTPQTIRRKQSVSTMQEPKEGTIGDSWRDLILLNLLTRSLPLISRNFQRHPLTWRGCICVCLRLCVCVCVWACVCAQRHTTDWCGKLSKVPYRTWVRCRTGFVCVPVSTANGCARHTWNDHHHVREKWRVIRSDPPAPSNHNLVVIIIHTHTPHPSFSLSLAYLQWFNG